MKRGSEGLRSIATMAAGRAKKADDDGGVGQQAG